MTVGHFLDSEVRSYSRSFPTVFSTASGSRLRAVDGRSWLDFFCGAGALNYGHNEPSLKRALIAFIESDGVMHGLDTATCARNAFLDRFHTAILRPRGMNYRVQFTGPTGANAIEAALKLARKATGRKNVFAFCRAYHGLSQGALAVTANAYYRAYSPGLQANTVFLPYECYLPDVDSLAWIRKLIEDRSSGVDLPAAVILETIQAEGGIYVASTKWLRGLASLCQEFDILLIVDDIQVGCGRAGTFFSFEDAGIAPDIIVLSKSISGYGFPMAMNLIRPEIDCWNPGEHNGTFRGNGAAFVTATEALRFWEDPEFGKRLLEASSFFSTQVDALRSRFPGLCIEIRGRGMIVGLETADADISQRIAQDCFARGLLVESCSGEARFLSSCRH